jgi:hypothetical protein
MTDSVYGLLLAGWEDLSTWGYDSGTGSHYAQLTRNGRSDDNGPEVWITPSASQPPIARAQDLAPLIANATNTELAAVQEAMKAGSPGS